MTEVLDNQEEIEDDDQQKLSLTSLLLESANTFVNVGMPRGREPETSPLGYDRSPRQPRVNPGARRNGNPAGSSRTDMLAVEELQGSLDSMAPGEEEELALEEARRGSNDDSRRGSLNILTNRRGSRLSDIILMQERRKKNRGRFKDKQGFTWRPFIAADEELPIPRAPHPHIDIPQPQPQPSPSINSQDSRINIPESEPTQPTPQLKTKNPSPRQPSWPMRPPNGDVRAPPRTQTRRKKLPILFSDDEDRWRKITF